MQKSESITELAKSLNQVQATLQAAKKGSENPFFKSTYADLLSVWNACRDSLTSNGLSIVQVAGIDEQGHGYLETILLHTSGEWISGALPLMTIKQDPQAQGSAMTYARRYSLSAIVGLCTEEDDDAEAAMGREKPETHWCSVHKTAFFKKGKMKSYAHPIKDATGEDTGEWCSQHTEGATTNAADNSSLQQEEVHTDETELLIDMDWLKESLKTLNNEPFLRKGWSNTDVILYLNSMTQSGAKTVLGAVKALNKEQAADFVERVQKELENV